MVKALQLPEIFILLKVEHAYPALQLILIARGQVLVLVLLELVHRQGILDRLLLIRRHAVAISALSYAPHHLKPAY